MSDLDENLKKKVVVTQKHVALCHMNQCTRGSGVPLIIALDDNEGVVKTAAEKHKNRHREHEKQLARVLEQSRTAGKAKEVP